MFLGSSESLAGAVPEESAGSRKHGHGPSAAELCQEGITQGVLGCRYFRYSLTSLVLHDGIPPNLHNPA